MLQKKYGEDMQSIENLKDTEIQQAKNDLYVVVENIRNLIAQYQVGAVEEDEQNAEQLLEMLYDHFEKKNNMDAYQDAQNELTVLRQELKNKVKANEELRQQCAELRRRLGEVTEELKAKQDELRQKAEEVEKQKTLNDELVEVMQENWDAKKDDNKDLEEELSDQLQVMKLQKKEAENEAQLLKVKLMNHNQVQQKMSHKIDQQTRNHSPTPFLVEIQRLQSDSHFIQRELDSLRHQYAADKQKWLSEKGELTIKHNKLKSDFSELQRTQTH